MKRMRRRLLQQPLRGERERRKSVFKITDPNPIFAVSVAEVTTPQVISSVILRDVKPKYRLIAVMAMYSTCAYIGSGLSKC